MITTSHHEIRKSRGSTPRSILVSFPLPATSVAVPAASTRTRDCTTLKNEGIYADESLKIDDDTTKTETLGFLKSAVKIRSGQIMRYNNFLSLFCEILMLSYIREHSARGRIQELEFESLCRVSVKPVNAIAKNG